MKALALCLFLLPLAGFSQEAEIDSLHKFCPCADDGNIKRALKKKWLAGSHGAIYQIRCDGFSYFFLLPPRSRLSQSIFLNGKNVFESRDKILTAGPLWFYVKISDSENMKYDFETRSWSRDKIRDGALGEERY